MNNTLFHIFKGITALSLMYKNMLKTNEIRYNDKFDTTTFLLGTKCVVETSPDCTGFKYFSILYSTGFK